MFYRLDWGKCYDEMISWYPTFYRDVLEMNAILKAYGGISDDLQTAIETVLYNFFIDTADEPSVRRMEDFLGIYGEVTSSLEARKAYVKSYYLGFGKMSETIIRKIIATFSGYDSHCKLEPYDEVKNNCLYISFEENAELKDYIDGIARLLLRRVPAHLVMRFIYIDHTQGYLYSGAIPRVKYRIVVSSGNKPTDYEVGENDFVAFRKSREKMPCVIEGGDENEVLCSCN